MRWDSDEPVVEVEEAEAREAAAAMQQRRVVVGLRLGRIIMLWRLCRVVDLDLDVVVAMMLVSMLLLSAISIPYSPDIDR